MQTYYSHGKLLISSEYAVLDGAKAFALPTKFGQHLEVRKSNKKNINWKSFDYQNNLWFETNFSIVSLSIGLFLKAVITDLVNFSLSNDDFLPFFLITVNSLN